MDLAITDRGQCPNCRSELRTIKELSTDNPNRHTEHLYAIRQCVRCGKEAGWADGYLAGVSRGVEFGKDLGDREGRRLLTQVVEDYLREAEFQAFLDGDYDREFWEGLFNIFGLNLLVSGDVKWLIRSSKIRG